jgi:hypothetical protein
MALAPPAVSEHGERPSPVEPPSQNGQTARVLPSSIAMPTSSSTVATVSRSRISSMS